MNNEGGIGIRFDESALREDPILQKARIAVPTLELPKGIPSPVLDRARTAWEDRTRSEYTGVMIVHHFHGLLVDVNAPMDLQEIALTMVKQEQEHAALCMAAARALGADGEVVFDLSELRMERTQAPLETQIMSMLVGTYAVGEVVAHRLLHHAIHALPQNGYQDILKRIYRDEVLHAHIGSAILASIREGASPKWLPYPGDEALAKLFADSITGMCSRDVVEEAELGFFDSPQWGEHLKSVGIPPARAFRKAYFEGLATNVGRSVRKAGLDPDRFPTLRQAFQRVNSHLDRLDTA